MNDICFSWEEDPKKKLAPVRWLYVRFKTNVSFLIGANKVSTRNRAVDFFSPDGYKVAVCCMYDIACIKVFYDDESEEIIYDKAR